MARLISGVHQPPQRRHRGPYTESEVDFIAAYIIPEDTWYVHPVRQVIIRTSVGFRPKGYARGDPTPTIARPGTCCASRTTSPSDEGLRTYDYLKDCLRENSPTLSAVYSPKRGTYLQASRGSKKALHRVMCSRRSSCESLDHTENPRRNTGRGEEWMKWRLQEASY